MSFGFSIGDFFTVIELANKIRKDFASAPEQYEGLAADVKNLSIILQDVEIFVEGNDLSQTQEENICKIVGRCKTVLQDINKTLDKYSTLSTNGTDSASSSLRRRARRVWLQFKLEPQEFREYRNAITTDVSMLNTFMGGITRDGVIKLIGIHDDRENQAILEWLCTADYHAQQMNNIRLQLENTGQWLFESDEYKEWLSSKDKMLFLHGIPGAGKTVLSSIVIEQLQARCREGVNLGLVYLYCEYNRLEAQHLDIVFLSWLRQLSEAAATIPTEVKQLFNDHKKRQTRPKLDEIKKVFHAVAKSFKGFYIIVDALDECQVAQGYQRQLIEELQSLYQSTGANVLATSRPIPNILAAFHDQLSVEVRANEHDIRGFIDANITDLPAFVLGSPDLQEEIKSCIVEAAEGMFLLAKLNFESLKGKTRKKQLRETLTLLVQRKGDYGEAYRKTMDVINSQHQDEKDLAIEVLAWIVYSENPMTTQELMHALAVEVDDTDIDEDNIPELQIVTSVCRGLISLQAQTGILQLIHYTTQEFFTKEGSTYLDGAKIRLSTACVAYLSLNEFGRGICHSRKEVEDRFVRYPFYACAIMQWVPHTKRACDYQLVCRFLGQEQLIAASRQAFLHLWPEIDSWLEEDEDPAWTALHFIAYMGLDQFLHYVLSQCDINAVDYRHWTALTYASKYGHEAVVRILLEEGADIQEATFVEACGNGHESVVRLLLETGTLLGGKGLIYASRHGHEDVVCLLLENGALVDSLDEAGVSALANASKYGHEAIVRLLLEKGAQINATDKLGQTALLLASIYGYEATVQTLLERGAQIDTTDQFGQTALSRAAERRHEAVVRVLLKRGAQVDITDQHGATALIYASQRGAEAVVRTLLEKGAQVDIVDKAGKTALASAAEFGYEAVVRILVERGAQLDITDTNGMTALMFACGRGNEAIVRILLGKGAKIDDVDRYGQTALVLAFKYGYQAVVRILVERGAQFDIRQQGWRG